MSQARLPSPPLLLTSPTLSHLPSPALTPPSHSSITPPSLLPSPSTLSPTPQAYGDPSGPASQILDGIVRVATACLDGFPGEAQLHSIVCKQLLPVRPAFIHANLLLSKHPCMGQPYADLASPCAVINWQTTLEPTLFLYYPPFHTHTHTHTHTTQVLVRRKTICRQLVLLASWQELAGAFASRQPALTQQLGQKLHRSLAQVWSERE